MGTGASAKLHSRRIAATLLCLFMAAAFLLPMTSHALTPAKTVRVGWFESPFNMTDEFGRRSGYSYEYQCKIAAYTGWKYEYVEGTWSELLDMLRRGEIDLMSDVSFKPDRAEYMLYPSLPMGTEAYYLYVVPGNEEIRSDDVSSLNGKLIGVTKDSIQESLFLEWEKEHGVEAEILELTSSEDLSLRYMQKGRMDAFLTLDSYGSPDEVEPVFKIGSSDFYFVVNKDRPDLLTELDAALSRIQDEDIYYSEKLNEKYLRNSSPNWYLNAEELAWLDDHGTIRVGYQDGYLAFCAADPETGELTGALKDYLEYAATGLENAELHFEATAYPTATAAMEALARGEVDCMFPANLNDSDSEERGVLMTPALMRTEMDAVVRASDQKEFIRNTRVTVAVNAGNPNYDMFLLDNYPGWTSVHFQDTPACLDAVAARQADCVIISNYRYSNIAKQCEKLNLTTVSTGVELDYCFAVRHGDTTLYSILSRVNSTVPESTVHAALTYYSTEDAKSSILDILNENIGLVVAVVGLVLAAILVLLQRDIRAQRMATEEHQKVEALNKRVFTDALTSVRNKGAYAQFIDGLQEKLNNPLTAADLAFAICVFDCDDLKSINDSYGHDKGDEYLKAASRLICGVFQHSPVFRIGGDEFAAVLQNEDYANRDALVRQFEEGCEAACAAAENEWERVRVSMGMAVFDADADPSVSDTVRRADKFMYENKRARKEAFARNCAETAE